ncbi:rhodanese-like domain-containing protein [Undibacterium amnicola]|uniref:Rhodanese-like domain-containing protein n=1 Tax=Undibacterium amnicola TaxID=1834038 RepID=A0ABR6XQJ7_9BURK|nr:rhodanese-like domain-containing protein [Undibacterium amnicola]MBC3831780.1 rhodanese-like domain-containing protein [Undibacterium amnicola]
MKTILLFFVAMFFSIQSFAQAVVIDVRTPSEYAEKHISGAINIDHSVIATEIQKLKLAKEDKIILYCRSGRRSGIALETLKKLGFENLENYGGLEEAQVRLLNRDVIKK